MADLLHLSGLDAWYGTRQVLHGVELTLPASGCTVLLGPSGTGKSTLLRCLAVFSQSSERDSRSDDWRASVSHITVAQPISVAAVHQKPKRPPGNVLQFFCEGVDDSAATVMQSLRELFAELGEAQLLPRVFADCAELDSGTWMAFAILRAAARGRHLLLFDEPTAGLTDEQAARVVDLIVRLAAGRSVVVVTHHVAQARALARQIILVGNGRVLEAAEGAQFFSQPRTEGGRHFLQNGSLPERGESAPETSQETNDLIEHAMAELAAERVPGRGKSHPLLPARFRWVVADCVAGVSIPGLLNDIRLDLQGLQGAGIDAMLNLTENPFDSSVAAEFGMDCLFAPIPDMGAPTLVQAIDICALLDKQLAQGRHVAVHCRAGQGRTGTVLALYMMWRSKGQWNAEQAVRAMRRIDPAWIQSASQVVFLSAFELYIRRNVTFA